MKRASESLGFEGDGRAVREQAEVALVGLEPIEAEDQRGSFATGYTTNYQAQ